jgi:uncharacterized membrane protein
MLSDKCKIGFPCRISLILYKSKMSFSKRYSIVFTTKIANVYVAFYDNTTYM